jgi:hypothetical protein
VEHTTSKHQRAAGPYRFEVAPDVFDSIVAAVQVGIDRALGGDNPVSEYDGATQLPAYLGIRTAVADILWDAREVTGAERSEMIGTVTA